MLLNKTSPAMSLSASLGKQVPIFRKILVPPSSGSSILLHDLEGEGTTNIHNVGNCLSKDTEYYPRSREVLMTLLQNLRIKRIIPIQDFVSYFLHQSLWKKKTNETIPCLKPNRLYFYLMELTVILAT